LLVAQNTPLDRLLDALNHDEMLVEIRAAGDLFERMAGPAADSIVLFGAGPLGRMTLQGLRQSGVEPLCFADNNQALWNTSVDGLEVLAPSEAVARYGASACFVVTIYNGSPVRTQLRGMNCTRIIPFPVLFWKYADAFIPGSGLELPHRIPPQADEIRACYDILADEWSRQELCEQVRWRCLLDYACLSRPLPGAEMHFAPDLVEPLPDEVFVDCGAFDGDSVCDFVARRGGAFSRLYALEPDEANRAALERSVGEMPEYIRAKISVLPYAAGDRSMRAGFFASNSVVSRLSETGATTYVECRRLDDVLADAAPTHIKMDIEGAEPEAIEGALGLLRTARPVISACAYHRCEHLWRLPLLLHRLAPDYKIFLRRYAEECWEMVCYGVPPERIPAERFR
jgi:FkbM family methyltransferase